jgi:hypothetical protein
MRQLPVGIWFPNVFRDVSTGFETGAGLILRRRLFSAVSKDA